MKFSRVTYSKLSAKQKEAYNFAHLSALLSEFGLSSIWLQDDWQGADCLAQTNENEFIKIQLKSRLTFDKKYIGKNLYIAFPYLEGFYIYPHDLILENYIEQFKPTKSWKENGHWSMAKPSKRDQKNIEPYFVSPTSTSLTL